MTMNEIDRYRVLARLRIDEIADEDQSLRRHLGRIRFVGWPLFIASIVCPVVAGSIVFASLVGGKQSVLVVILSLLGAVATAVHKGPDCDRYQAALRRVVQSLRGIAEAYEAAVILPDEVVIKTFESAESRLRELRASSTDLPPKRRQSFEVKWRSAQEGLPRQLDTEA